MNKRHPLTITVAVLFALILREMKGRFGRARLGALWVLLEPLVHVLGISLLAGAFRAHSDSAIEYPVFLFVALAPFFIFRNIALKLMESIEANRALFAYKQIKPLDTLISRTAVEVLRGSLIYLVIAIGFSWFGFDMSMNDSLSWLLAVLIGLMFSFALGVIFSIITDPLPGSKIFFRLAFIPLYFLSGVIFPLNRFPPEVMSYLLWNPYLHVIDSIRGAIFEHHVPIYGASLAYPGWATLVTLCLALGLYRARRLKLVAIQ